MIPSGEGRVLSNPKAMQAKSKGRQWRYLAAKKLSALLRGITSKHHCYFYFRNCLHSFATEKKCEAH